MAGPTGIASYSTTPGNNALTDGGAQNWQEQQLPSTVNNSSRQGLADLRLAFNDLMWFSYGSGDQDPGTNLGVPYTYFSANQVKVAGVNVMAAHEVGRRMRFVGATTGTVFGTITASAFSTDTTITVSLDAGALQNEALTGSLCQIPVTGNPLGGALTGSILGTANQIVATPAAGKVTLSLPSTILVAGPLAFGTSNAQPLIFDINSAEVARFDSAGRLLIGATAPLGSSQLLYVSNNVNADSTPVAIQNKSSGTGAATGLAVTNDLGVGALIYTYGSNVANAGLSYRAGGTLFVGTGPGGVTYGNNAAAAPIYFMTGNPGVEIARFDANGQLGIGMVPAFALDITQNGNTGGQGIQLTNSNNGTSAAARIRMNAGGPTTLDIGMFAAGYTPNGLYQPGQAYFACYNTGGLLFNNIAVGPIVFAVNNIERGRFATGGDFCWGRTATFQSAGFSCTNNVASVPAGEFLNVSGTPRGLFIYYSTAANTTGSATTFFTCYDSGTTRLTISSNGGINNPQANNVNTSDAELKKDIEPLAPFIAKLWSAHRDMAWSRYRFKDQTHSDWNWGYTAQDIRKTFGKIAPELVDDVEMMPTHDLETGEEVKPAFTVLGVYSDDLHNIGHALLSEAQRRIEALEAKVKKMETRH